MRLFLIRHGAVVPPAPGAFYGGADVPLSEVGEAEAKAAAQFLATIEVDHIVASPLQRAHFGAEQVASGRSLPVELHDGLREIDRGRWFGLTAEQIDQRYPGDLVAHAADPRGWREHGGESLDDLRQRVLAVRDDIRREHQGKTVVLVSHMHPTRAIVADSKGLDLEQFGTLAIATASVSMVDYDSAGQGRVGWFGHKPDGLGAERAYPHFFD